MSNETQNTNAAVEAARTAKPISRTELMRRNVPAWQRRQIPILINDRMTESACYKDEDMAAFWETIAELEEMQSGKRPFDNGIEFVTVTLPEEPASTETYKVVFIVPVRKQRAAKVCLMTNLRLLNFPQVRNLDDPHYVQLTVSEATRAEVQTVYEANRALFTDMKINVPEPKAPRQATRRRFGR